jgi:hypothetical protein
MDPDDLINTWKIGCGSCPYKEMCGGSIGRNSWDCFEYCSGCDPETCDRICPTAGARKFQEHLYRLGGFGFADIDPLSHAFQPPNDFPRYIPKIYGSSGRTTCAPLPWAAIMLRDICSGDGQEYGPNVSTAGGLLSKFQLGLGTRTLLLPLVEDPPLEKFWKLHRATRTCERLAELGFSAAVSPNFSLVLNHPRTNHMGNRKRGWIAASRLSAAGLPMVLYLHAITDADWDYLADFLREHTEISCVAEEFGTGARSCRGFGEVWITKIAELQQRIGRRFHLLAVAGRQFVPELVHHLTDWTIVDGNAYTYTSHRKRCHVVGTRLGRSQEPDDTDLSKLLIHNVRAYEQHIRELERDATNQRQLAG